VGDEPGRVKLVTLDDREYRSRHHLVLFDDEQRRKLSDLLTGKYGQSVRRNWRDWIVAAAAVGVLLTDILTRTGH
jgi:type II secretory pathway component PulL